jgi:hypothetical protein
MNLLLRLNGTGRLAVFSFIKCLLFSGLTHSSSDASSSLLEHQLVFGTLNATQTQKDKAHWVEQPRGVCAIIWVQSHLVHSLLPFVK